jgi:hypothetical protein
MRAGNSLLFFSLILLTGLTDGWLFQRCPGKDFYNNFLIKAMYNALSEKGVY